MSAELQAGTQPVLVECATCEHVWIGFYLPQLILIAARIMRQLTCPKCGADSHRIRIRA